MFQTFLRERNYPAVRQQFFTGDRAGAGESYVGITAMRNQWTRRVAEYDRWLASTRDDMLVALIKNEVREIARRRLDILDGMYRITRSAERVVLPENAAEDHKVKLADALVYTKIAQALLAEYRNLEQDSPAGATDSKPFADKLMGAQQRLQDMFPMKPLTEPKPATIPETGEAQTAPGTGKSEFVQ